MLPVAESAGVGLKCPNPRHPRSVQYKRAREKQFLISKWYAETAICLGLFLVCSVALYFTWFKRLPEQ